MSLILDRDHEVLLHDWIGTAQKRVLVASHKLGMACEPRLVIAEVERPDDFTFDVVYGRSDADKELVDRVTKSLRKGRGDLACVPDLHAKVVISDESACVTSYNFLSADPFGTARNARELGVVIDGAEPSNWLWNALRQVLTHQLGRG